MGTRYFSGSRSTSAWSSGHDSEGSGSEVRTASRGACARSDAGVPPPRESAPRPGGRLRKASTPPNHACESSTPAAPVPEMSPERILGRVPIGERLVADPQDHRTVPFHQRPESRLSGSASILDEPLQQIAIAEISHRPRDEQVFKLPQQRTLDP